MISVVILFSVCNEYWIFSIDMSMTNIAFDVSLVSSSAFRRTESQLVVWRNGTQHNDIRHNDNQHNDIQYDT